MEEDLRITGKLTSLVKVSVLTLRLTGSHERVKKRKLKTRRRIYNAELRLATTPGPCEPELSPAWKVALRGLAVKC